MEDNDKFPKIIYGTAWKEEDTETLVVNAIKSGFVGIDTANQRRHYYEEAVGRAIKKVIGEGIKREELFLQTKFTYIDGQDHRLPYEANADIQTQLRQSFNSSLGHLGLDYLDSYLLHGPERSIMLTQNDLKVWKEMEAIQKEGKVKYIGISNVNFDQLKELYEKSEIKPKFVQNRCYAQTGWDKDIRKYCKENNIIYQGFSLLTANINIFSDVRLNVITEKYGKTVAQIIFAFATQVGMIALTGTRDVTHMKEDLSIIDFKLTEEEVRIIEDVGL